MNPRGSTRTESLKRHEVVKKTHTAHLFVLSGPSGVGKSTVADRLLEKVPNLRRSVSATTRAKRPGEQEGIDYFFRSRDEFDELVKEDDLLEWAEFAGNRYGTPKSWVQDTLAKGIDVILVIEVQGAGQIKEKFEDAVLIFLSPPSHESLLERLRGRGTETEEKISIRLAKAKVEMKEKHRFHYEVVNDDIDEAVNNLAHIVYAERCRI